VASGGFLLGAFVDFSAGCFTLNCSCLFHLLQWVSLVLKHSHTIPVVMQEEGHLSFDCAMADCKQLDRQCARQSTDLLVLGKCLC
jgi:hypothetical protein